MLSLSAQIFLFESSYLKLRRQRRRRYGVQPIFSNRKTHGEFHNLHTLLENDNRKFFEYYRMGVPTFHYILSKIGPHITRQRKSAISSKEKLAVTLRFLATGNSYRSLAFSFRIAHSTISGIVAEVCHAIWMQLSPIHMVMPTEVDHKKCAETFLRKWHFPNCVGAIDGKHIRIKCPSQSGSISIVMQGVSDANYRFVCIEVAAIDKKSDGGIYETSNLRRLIESGTFNLPAPYRLPIVNVEAPYVFIGDEAFPLQTYLLRAYANPRLNDQQTMFNEALTKARQTVECAFGLTISKWRVLGKRIDTNVANAITVTKCACLLHNVIYDREGIDEDVLQAFRLSSANSEESQVTNATDGRRSRLSAKHVRNIFAQYFTASALQASATAGHANSSTNA